MNWRVEKRLHTVAVGPAIPIDVLVGEDGTEVEMRETRDGWYACLTRESQNVRFFVSRCYRSVATDEPNSEPCQIGPLCSVAYDAKYNSKISDVDPTGFDDIAMCLKDALRNVWRLPRGPQVRVTAVIFSSRDFIGFSDDIDLARLRFPFR